LKDGISEAGNVRAGVPQGSALHPLLFLVYVNDIADEVLGLCRLFACFIWIKFNKPLF
jgi:hypothetical protein